MFKYIGRYTPAPLEPLPMKLMPFIPEYIPAAGGSDEFIKVPRPDGQPDYLGLKVRRGVEISSLYTPVCAGQRCTPGLLYQVLQALAGPVAMQGMGRCRTVRCVACSRGCCCCLTGPMQVLDEPAAVQSDPTLLNLQLRALGKEAAGVKLQALGSIPHHAPDK